MTRTSHFRAKRLAMTDAVWTATPSAALPPRRAARLRSRHALPATCQPSHPRTTCDSPITGSASTTATGHFDRVSLANRGRCPGSQPITAPRNPSGPIGSKHTAGNRQRPRSQTRRCVRAGSRHGTLRIRSVAASSFGTRRPSAASSARPPTDHTCRAPPHRSSAGRPTTVRGDE